MALVVIIAVIVAIAVNMTRVIIAFCFKVCGRDLPSIGFHNQGDPTIQAPMN